jgi:hypothetical protein
VAALSKVRMVFGRSKTGIVDSNPAPGMDVWRFIQKFPDWVSNEINNNNKHLLRSDTKGYGGKTHCT